MFFVATSVFLLLALSIFVIGVDSLASTIFLLAITLGIPFLFYNSSERKLPGVNYARVANLFYLKVLISFFVLEIAWVPLLGGSEGYDPIRYFYYAKVFAESNFDLSTLGYMELLSPGIIYLYAIIVKTIGWNPIIPFLINSILSFTVCLLLGKTISLVFGKSRALTGICLLCLLVPDVLWFDVITSRDSVVTFFLCVSVFIAMWLMDPEYRRSKTRGHLFLMSSVLFFSNIGLIVIRPGVIVISLVIIFGILINTYRRKITKRVIVLFGLTMIVLAILAPIIVFDVLNINREFIESKFEVSKVIETAQANVDIADANGISARFVPANLFELVLFTPIKALAYMFVSITQIPGTVINVFRGDLSDTQLLFMGASSIIYILLFHRFLVVLTSAVAVNRNFLAAFPFFATIFVTVLSNQFIHERYRLMSIPFFIFSIYPSFSMDSNRIVQAKRYWYSFFTATIMLYVFIKL